MTHPNKDIGISLNIKSDRDIIDWLATLPHREISLGVREAIRVFIAGEGAHERMTREMWEMVMSRGWVAREPIVVDGELERVTEENLKGFGQ